MKKQRFLVSIMFLFFSINMIAQRGLITLNFNGQDSETTSAIALEKVYVKNISKNCDTIVYGPNAQLILDFVDDINEIENHGFIIGNNYPNPFSGETYFDLQLNEPEEIRIRLLNTQGVLVTEYNNVIPNGTHIIKVSVPRAGVYLAEVSSLKAKRTIRLISKSSSSQKKFNISYAGENSNISVVNYKSTNSGFIFQIGDELQITASADTYPDETINNSPITDMDFTFDMRPIPIANFSIGSLEGAFPFTTSFIDLSQRNPTTWNWNFGDGWSSELQNNYHTFETSGYHTVSLMVGNEYGNDTLVMEDIINVKDIHIICDTTEGYSPLNINFSGICNISDITSWTWDFGDGETSNEQNPSHIYINSGNYNKAKVSVTSGGNVYSDSTTIRVFSDLAELNFTADITNGWVPQTINFTSYTNINNPIGYQWSFGDGNVSNLQNPTHMYDNIGTFTVILSIYDNNGYKTATKEDYITIRYCPGAVADADGNVYSTVGIGELCWMSENLNVGIRTNSEDGAQTDNGIAEKFCYDDLESNCDEYGGLYEWDELVQYTTGYVTQGLCPDEWHIMNKTDWDHLVETQGGLYQADKLKSTTGWIDDKNGTNESGFNALPGGAYYGNSYFSGIGSQAHLVGVNGQSNFRSFLANDFIMGLPPLINNGYSVRCVKDNTLKK